MLWISSKQQNDDEDEEEDDEDDNINHNAAASSPKAKSGIKRSRKANYVWTFSRSIGQASDGEDGFLKDRNAMLIEVSFVLLTMIQSQHSHIFFCF